MRMNAYILCFSIFVGIFPIHLYSQLSEKDQEKINFLSQSAEEYKHSGNWLLSANYFNKLAYLHWEKNQPVEAIKCFHESMELNKLLANKNAIKVIFFNLGMLYSETEQYEKAANSIKNGINICKELNDRNCLSSGFINLGIALKNMGQYNEATEAVNKALRIFLEENNLELTRTCYGHLAEIHEQIGNTEQMIKYFDLFSAIDKQIKAKQVKEIQEKTRQEVNKVEAEKMATQEKLDIQISHLRETKDSLVRVKLETEKQRLKLKLQELQISEKESELKKRRLIIFSLLIIVLIILVFSGILLKLYKDKKKAHYQLDLQNRQIKSSIEYARRIQNAILPMEEKLYTCFESFIIYYPKDIVSGDFYWYSNMMQEDNKEHVIAVVDCTGHGVPGAFMSMIGNMLLNEIINELKINCPSKILEQLDDEVVCSLQQEHTENSDGMDVCLCKIKKIKDDYRLEFSGAKRPLFLYRKEKNEIEIHEGTRRSIGGFNKNKKNNKFQNIILDAKPGDILFLSTDGLVDQNSEERKRFGTAKLANILKKNIELDMEKQKEACIEALKQHMKNVPQRDDITLIGLRLL